MAKYKQRKVEGNIGSAIRGMAADYVNKGTQVNKSAFNEVDHAWFDYWVGRTELGNKNNARLDEIDHQYLMSQQSQITPVQQGDNNNKAAAIAEVLGVDADKAAFIMQMLAK